jgi:hypothetical protein
MGRTMDALPKQPADELAGLRRFLERLESPGTTLFRNQIDVTDSDRIFAGVRSKGQYA